MALRLINTIEADSNTAKVYRDSDWNEYRVKFFASGVHQVDADYHTTSKEDAISTAESIVKQL